MASETSERQIWLWLGAATIAIAIAILVLAIDWGADETTSSAPLPVDEPPAEPEPPIVLHPATERQVVAPLPSAAEPPPAVEPSGALPPPSGSLGMIVSGPCRDYEAVACGCNREELCVETRARIRAWMGGGDYRRALERCERNIEPARRACAN